MPVYLDNQPLAVSGADLGAAVAAGRAAADKAGRIIVEVLLDGQVIGGADLEAKRATAITGADVRLVSADPRELALAALDQARRQLDDTRLALREAAEAFQRDQAGKGLERIGQAIQTWAQVPQAVVQCATLLGVALDQLAVEGRALPQMTQDLAAQIKGLHDLITGGDTSALADALAYEWPATVDRWDKLAQTLARRIESPPAP